MKQVFFFAFILILGACGSKDKKSEGEVAPATTPGTTIQTQSGTPVTINAGQPAITPSPVVPAPAATTVAAGMNPAHGQPGHRCDIPVGSPLSSPVTTKPTTTPPATAPAISAAPAISPAAPVTTTAAGMNPAHGQPGHRCDIPVGSPLNTPATTPVKKQ